MLQELFPRCHRRYSALPVLGGFLNDYIRWAFALGYHRGRVRNHLRSVRRLEDALRSQGVSRPEDLTWDRLDACIPRDSQDDPDLAGVGRLFERYLVEEMGRLQQPPASRIAKKVATYRHFLETVRGLAPSTMAHHCATVAELLGQIGYEDTPLRLQAISIQDIEKFLQTVGARTGRANLQHVVAHLRGFLKFLRISGEISRRMEHPIDTARVYRGEQLPKALPWTTVEALLRGIDRKTPMGRRDYAIFLLIATYGLRSAEVVRLRLEDIEWRARRLRVVATKRGVSRWLPLTDEVASALVEYLRASRPASHHREVFLRCRTPMGVLKPTAVTEAFQAWSRRSGLPIPFQGAHCLRHSLAIHLLRQGTAVKTIGDLLGHRNNESTCVYLRLSIEDLREVPLPLPAEHSTSPVGAEAVR